MAASEQIDVPIFRLPDELLLEIFSYITSIDQKILLEQVSRKFNHLSFDPSNWNGIDSLELIIKCDKHLLSGISMLKTNCDIDNVHLNGVAVQFENWPKAIESFLHRTQLHHFTIHFGEDIYSLVSSSDIFPRLLELFGQKQDKIKIESMEVHSTNNFDIYRTDGLRAFILDLLNSAAPHLQEIRFADFDFCTRTRNPNFGPLIWPIIHKCNKLKSIYWRDVNSEVDFGALLAKPLTQMTFSLPSKFYFDGSSATRDFVNVINGVSGDGLQSLSIEGDSLCCFIKYLHLYSHLSEKARNKLKFLSLSNWLDGHFVIKYMALIPLIFPNIERCDIGCGQMFLDDDINQFYAVINDLFYLTHDGPITRRFTLHSTCVRHCNESTFKAELTETCHNNQIDIDFGEMLPTPYVYLSKGKASLIIRDIGFLSWE